MQYLKFGLLSILSLIQMYFFSQIKNENVKAYFQGFLKVTKDD